MDLGTVPNANPEGDPAVDAVTPDANSGANPDTTPDDNPDATPGDNPDATPGDNPDSNPGDNPDANPVVSRAVNANPAADVGANVDDEDDMDPKTGLSIFPTPPSGTPPPRIPLDQPDSTVWKSAMSW